MNIFELIFFQPIFNALIWLHNAIPGHDIGLAIVALTILIKVILAPFSVKMLRSQRALQVLQPKLQELQKKHKGDREALGKATMELYKKEKVNPFSSCLPLLIQLPFLFAVFQVFREGLKEETLAFLYSFVQNPGVINPVSFGLVDLNTPSIPLALLAGAAQFWQTRMLTHKKQPSVPGAKDEGMASMMNKQMMYVLPVVTVVIGASLPGGLTLYWFLFTLLTALQQKFIFSRDDRENKSEDNNTAKQKVISGEVISSQSDTGTSQS